MKNISKKLWQFKLLCFTYNLSIVQKRNFKKCPFISMVPLIMFLPTYGKTWLAFKALLKGFVVQFSCLLCIYSPSILVLVPRSDSCNKWESLHNVKYLCIHSHHEIQMGCQSASQFILHERHIRKTPLIFLVTYNHSHGQLHQLCHSNNLK
jgi:hypothetical protein